MEIIHDHHVDSRGCLVKLHVAPSICVVDIGSPKLGNLGWYLYDAHHNARYSGDDLDAMLAPLHAVLAHTPILIGLEAPLFVPLRDDLMLATKARAGENPRPWSAGAGAQVLAMNLPIMTYLFQRMHQNQCRFTLDAAEFKGDPGEVLLFEALVSGADKGQSHIEDAQIMVDYCCQYTQIKQLPPSILQDEMQVSYMNLAACALLRTGHLRGLDCLSVASPIYRPSS